MKHMVCKVFTIGQYEQEERWLNEMSAKGLLLTDVGFCRYTFAEGTPGEYLYRLELLNQWPTHPESAAYIRFLEETGVEHVGSLLRWVYFRRKAADGPFELYSDIGSKIKHLRRITWMSNTLSLVFLVPAVIWLWEAWNKISDYLIWKDRGFPDQQPFFTSPLLTGLLYLLMIVLYQLIVLPVRRSLRRLKAEQKVRE